MTCTQLLTSVAVVAFTLLGATPSFAKGGHGGGHGGHSHASAHHASHSRSFAHHGHSSGAHFGANHSFAHNHGFAHNYAGWNHGGWNHGGWGHGWGGWGYGFGHRRGWGYAGWTGPAYGGWGAGYVGSGVVDPSYYYNYGVTSPVVPTTNRTVTRNYVTDVIEPVAPLVVPPAPADPTPIVSQQSVNDSTTVALGSGSAPTVAH
jgi:hypothetical protein